MILTNDKPKTGKKKKEVEAGTRTLATRFFDGLQAKKNLLLPATVYFTSRGGHGSGVILGVVHNKVYMMTAKHVLHILAGIKSPGDTPDQYLLDQNTHLNPTKYPDGITVHYDPPSLLEPPRQTALITEIDFGGLDDGTWDYDIALVASNDQAMVGFATGKFPPTGNYGAYRQQLKQGQKYPLLNSGHYTFIQLGYGAARDTDWIGVNTQDYTDYGGKLQCKQSWVTADRPSPEPLYSPDRAKERDKWPKRTNVIELNADDAQSSGEGDSGGPLFCFESKGQAIFLLGVTTGANWYSDEERLGNPPNDFHIRNNIVTYWEPIFNYWLNLEFA